MEYFSVDRIEENIVVLTGDDERVFKEKITDLPCGIKEGTVLIKDSDGNFRIDENEEKRRKERIANLQESIFGE